MSWEIVKEILLWLEPYAFIFVVAICAYTTVLMLGRGMKFVESPRVKNIIATIYIVVGLFFYFKYYKGHPYDIKLFLGVIMFSCFSLLFYMLVLWRLFDRMDSFFDKLIGKDKGDPSFPKKKKVPKKKPPVKK